MSLVLSIYFSCLVSFLFLSHPVLCCLLLLSGSLVVCGYLFMFMGFSWYVCLFCLVYVGGVYILFIFVSVCTPNVGLGSGFNLVSFIGLVSAFFFVFWGVNSLTLWLTDYSFYLCSSSEGLLYCIFCVIMLIGLLVVSSIASRKDSYYR
uniref:NADH dehydrogenase subunit 6 n=1 Tax=Clinostomum complanatum TaxID=235145 RepID=A0A0F6PKF7_CLICO|nr:NADH dehydrogenase subunit 6 [Clinostomum complanatum]AJR28006.1 NADH dehydrogenase subunit 6 [Clinostomum complanatum]